MKFQTSSILPNLHSKNVYFLLLVAGIVACIVLGSELPVSFNFDGIWRVAAFNTIILSLLLINAFDQRREFRAQTLSKVRVLSYLFVFSTFWGGVFQRTEIAGGIRGTQCTAEGVRPIYVGGSNATYRDPVTISFLSSCQPGWVELINYGGAHVGTKCCVDLPSDEPITCSSGMRLVPDLSRNADLLSSRGLKEFGECCPSMVGGTIPPGFTTMGLSALFGIMGNVLFNLFKRTPAWTALKRVHHRVKKTEIWQACRGAFASVVARVFVTPAVQQTNHTAIDENHHVEATAELASQSSDAFAPPIPVPLPALDNTAEGDASSPQQDSDVTVVTSISTSMFDQTIRRVSSVFPQLCEYAFDRTVRCMLGSATLVSSPCHQFFAVSALNDDTKRHVALYDVERFKEKARPISHHEFVDILTIPNCEDVAVSINGRWLACIARSGKQWMLCSADNGTMLAAWSVPPSDPSCLSSITFAASAVDAEEDPMVVAHVIACCGQTLLHWTVNRIPRKEHSVALQQSSTHGFGAEPSDFDYSRFDDVAEFRNVTIALCDASTTVSLPPAADPMSVVLCGDFSLIPTRSGDVVLLPWQCAEESDTADMSSVVPCRNRSEFYLREVKQLNDSEDDDVVQIVVAKPTLRDDTENELNGSDMELSRKFDNDHCVSNDSEWFKTHHRIAWRGSDGSLWWSSFPKDASVQTPADQILVQRIHSSGALENWTCMALSPTGTTLACGRRNGAVVIFSHDGRVVQEYHYHSGQVSSICFVDEHHVASSGYEGLFVVVDIRLSDDDPHHKQQELTPGLAYVDMTLFPDGNRMVCVTEGFEVQVQNVGALVSQGRDTFVSVPLAISSKRADNVVVAAVYNSVDQIEIRHIDVADGNYVTVIADYLPAKSVYMSPHGSLMVVLGRDGSISSYHVQVNSHHAGPVPLAARTLSAERLIDRKRGPYTAVECVALSNRADDDDGTTDADVVIVVGVEKLSQNYRLHVFTVSTPLHGADTITARRKSVVVNIPKIHLSENLFLTQDSSPPSSNADDSKSTVDVPLTSVALSPDAKKLCLWIGADVFVCEIDARKRSVQVMCVLHGSKVLREQKLFDSPIHLKATGGALQIDDRHGGRVLRIIEHDQHFYVEEWHRVYRERDPNSAWLVDTKSKIIRFRSHLEVKTSQGGTTPSGEAVRVSAKTISSSEDGSRNANAVTSSRSRVQFEIDTTTGRDAMSGYIEIARPEDDVEAIAASTSPQDTPTTTKDTDGTSPAITWNYPEILEVYGYPKSQDPMKHRIRAFMNSIFPLLRTDELSKTSIVAMLLPRGDGVITTALCGTAFWPRERSTGRSNMTFEVSKFIVDMFQPSEYLVLKAVLATIFGVSAAVVAAVNSKDDNSISMWTRYALFCSALANGPIYSSIVDPVSALTVHLHLQRSGLFPIAGSASTTTPHLYADKNSFHQAYLSVGMAVFLTLSSFWFSGFVAVGPFIGTLLIGCALINGTVRLILNSPLISVSNATRNATWTRRLLAWLRHVLLFLLCLLDNVNINFFLQAVLRFPVNSAIVLYGAAPYPFFPYFIAHSITPEFAGQVNMTLPTSAMNIHELPYFSPAGAAVAHVPFYTMQMSSASCNAVKLTNTVLQQINTILLFM